MEVPNFWVYNPVFLVPDAVTVLSITFCQVSVSRQEVSADPAMDTDDVIGPHTVQTTHSAAPGWTVQPQLSGDTSQVSDRNFPTMLLKPAVS